MARMTKLYTNEERHSIINSLHPDERMQVLDEKDEAPECEECSQQATFYGKFSALCDECMAESLSYNDCTDD